MKVTDEMVELAEHTYRIGLGYSKRLGNNEAMKAALEAVFSLIEKESAENAQLEPRLTLTKIIQCDDCKRILNKSTQEEQPDNEGWIEWESHLAPNLPIHTQVELKFADGDVDEGFISDPWLWPRVTAYRILPNQTPEKEVCVCKKGGNTFEVYLFNPIPTCVKCNEPVIPPQQAKIPTLREHAAAFYKQVASLDEIIALGVIEVISEYLDKYMQHKE